MVEIIRDCYGHSQVQLTTHVTCDCGKFFTEADEWIDIEYIPDAHVRTITCPKCGKTYAYRERFQVVQEVTATKEVPSSECWQCEDPFTADCSGCELAKKE